MLNAEKYNLYDYSKDVNFIIQFSDYLSIDKSPSTVKTYKNNIIYFFKFIILKKIIYIFVVLKFYTKI